MSLGFPGLWTWIGKVKKRGEVWTRFQQEIAKADTFDT